MKGALESHKAFPLIAWTVFIMFACFTMYLALQLHETAVYLEGKMDLRVEALGST